MLFRVMMMNKNTGKLGKLAAHTQKAKATAQRYRKSIAQITPHPGVVFPDLATFRDKQQKSTTTLPELRLQEHY